MVDPAALAPPLFQDVDFSIAYNQTKSLDLSAAKGRAYLAVDNPGSYWVHFPQIQGAFAWVPPSTFGWVAPLPATHPAQLHVTTVDLPTGYNADSTNQSAVAVITVMSDFPRISLGVQQLVTTKVAATTGLTVYNVQAAPYSAKGDGVTDDTSAIQSAINAAGQAGGGIVYFPPGTYAVSSLTIGYNNLVLLGAGERSTVISTSSATADVIVATGQTAVQISELTFTASVLRTAGSLFNWTGMIRSTIHDVTLGDLFNLGTFTTCQQLTLANIRYAHGTGNVNRGFYFTGCTSVHCANFTWSCGSATLAASQGWLMIDTSCDTLLFSDIEIAVSSGTGGAGAACLWIQDQVGGGHAPRWVRFANFSFQAGTSSAGIHIQDGAFDCYFVNGYLTSCQDGLDVQGGKNLRFVNVVLASNQQYGANLTSSGGKAISYVNFEDCAFDSNSQAANNTYDHLLVSAANVSVVSIRGSLFTNALLGGASKAKYAIENACTTTYEAECTIEASGWATAAVLETAAMDGEVKVIPAVSGIATALTGAFAAVANSDIGAQISDFGSGNAYMIRAVAIEKGLTAADSGRVRIFDTGATAVFAADIATAAPDTGAFRVTSAWAALLSARHTLRLEVENATAARGNLEQGWYEVRRVG